MKREEKMRGEAEHNNNREARPSGAGERAKWPSDEKAIIGYMRDWPKGS